MGEAETEDITSTEDNEMVSVDIINRNVIDQPVMTYCLTNAWAVSENVQGEGLGALAET